MKIKLALLEKDGNYLSRLVSTFETKYADKLEIYSFTDKEIAMSTLDSARIDVFVASDIFDIDTEKLPKRCGFAYFVDAANVDTVNEWQAISKFQKADLIYKQILSIYSEKAASVSGLRLGDDNCKVIAFTSPCGGVGSSTMAAACALYFASQGKKTLYLNIEKFGSSDVFFSAEGQFDMSDIIFTLKSKKANFALKLESCVKKDKRNVYFYSAPKIALDMHELTADEVIRLISELKLTASYDYIIVDIDFGIDKNLLKIFRLMTSIVWVGDGSEISNVKLSRAYVALSTIEQNEDSPLTKRVSLAYNKFSNKTSNTIDDIEIRTLGGAPRYQHASVEQILTQLSQMDIYNKIN